MVITPPESGGSSVRILMVHFNCSQHYCFHKFIFAKSLPVSSEHFRNTVLRVEKLGTVVQLTGVQGFCLLNAFVTGVNTAIIFSACWIVIRLPPC